MSIPPPSSYRTECHERTGHAKDASLGSRGPARFRHRAREPDGGRGLQGRTLVRARVLQVRAAHDVARDPRPALRQHLLRGLQGLPLGGRQHQCLPHGQAHRAHAEERRVPRAAEAGPGAAREDGPGGHRPGARRGARGPGRAVPAPDAVRHRRLDRRRHVARDRGDAGRAREPGVGLLREGREAASHLRRGEADAHRDADGPGEGGRQLRGGTRADDRGAPAASRGPGRVLPGRIRAGDGRRELPADPRRQDPDPQPRHAVPARRDARLDPDDRAAARLRGRGARSSPWTRCSTG